MFRILSGYFLFSLLVASNSFAGSFSKNPTQYQTVNTQAVMAQPIVMQQNISKYNNNSVYMDDIQKTGKPAVVCRQKNCSRLNDKVNQSFLYTSLFKLFYLNKNTKVSICEADPFNRSCMNKGIKFGLSVGGDVPAIGNINHATMYNVQFDEKFKNLFASFKYDTLVNGVKVECNTAKQRIFIRSSEEIMMISDDFFCDLSSGASPLTNMIINIDYIDLDYSLIGGYYSLGMMGKDVSGGKSGYMLMKFQNLGDMKNPSPIYNAQSKFEGSRNFLDADGGDIPVGEYKVLPYKTK